MESVDLWVSCSGITSAVEDAMVNEALDRMSSRASADGRRQGWSQSELQGQRPGPV